MSVWTPGQGEVLILIKLLKQDNLALTGAVILLVIGLAAVLAPWTSPYDPWQYYATFQTPSGLHLLGTNDIGQDILSELLYAGRTSLLVGALSALLAMALGVTIGILAGFRRGIIDELLMGFTDVILVIPALPLIILVSVYLGASIWNTILIIGLVLWPGTARVVRSQALSVRESGYIESARMMGAGSGWLIWKHVFPNILPLILAKFVLTLAAAMLMEASVSFLGLGDPSQKSWGTMLHYAYSRGGFFRNLWWWYLPPGLCISLSILAMTLISFGVEGKSDPRLKKALER
jgi:peptide/nickel transport system permease protein